MEFYLATGLNIIVLVASLSVWGGRLSTKIDALDVRLDDSKEVFNSGLTRVEEHLIRVNGQVRENMEGVAELRGQL